MRAEVQAGNLHAVIQPIHSNQPSQRGTVGRRVSDALNNHAQARHAILIVTHEALMGLDPALLRGWHVCIDEVPDGVASGVFSVTASWSTLDHLYGLDPIGDGRWWQVIPRDGVEPLKIGAIIHDAAESLVAFHKRIQGRCGVFVDIGDWAEAQQVRRKVKWWSVWTPMALRGCASVKIAGSGFFDSLACHAAKWANGDAITFEIVNIGAQQPPTGHPRVVIAYYTRHPGSTEWWDTDKGSRCLVQVSRHLERIKLSGFWSANETIRPYFRHRFPAQECAPKLAGTNSLIEHTACAYIYSNKAQQADGAILDVLGLDRDAIRRAREIEDLLQFIMRGAIRRPEFGGRYDIHVYSLDQAEEVERYFVGAGITTNIELVPAHEAGILDVTRPRSKGACAKADVNSVSQRERKERERKRGQKRRARQKEEALANGTYRGRGRPKKP